MTELENNDPWHSGLAPGRLDVMGGIADYSGSLLLQMPIRETTKVEIQGRTDNIFHLQTSINLTSILEFEVNFKDLSGKNLVEAGKYLDSIPNGDWASYVIGCFLLMKQEKDLAITGANIRITTDIPPGKGVSSSAAIEVATMHAICKMSGLRLQENELPVLSQKVENEVVGAACGLMDQLAVHFGQKNKLLPIICQPVNVLEPISIPAVIEFCGIDSGVRHAVGGASYGDVRTAAFMGYTIIAMMEGIDKASLENARVSGEISSLPYGGYLANIPVKLFVEKYAKALPVKISGKDFLNRYAGSIDRATVINQETEYRVLACTQHPVYENERVNRFSDLLQQLNLNQDAEEIFIELGRLMLGSHESYSAVGLGNPSTDEILNEVMTLGPSSGLYGGRISGGGNGGTVAILCSSGKGIAAAKEVHRKFQIKYGKALHFFTGSSNGARYLNE